MRKLILLFLTCCIFNSCTLKRFSAYLPVAVNAPLLKGKSDGMVQATGGQNHVDLQAAYAPTNHVALLANGWIGFDGRYSVELAPGMYTFKSNSICYELFAGGGLASASTSKPYSYKDGIIGIVTTYTIKYVTHAPYKFVFIQPSIGIRKRIWELAFAFRISNVFYDNFNYKRYEKNNYDRKQYYLTETIDAGNLRLYSLQPAIIVRVGFRKIKAFISISANGRYEEGTIKFSNGFKYPYYQPLVLAAGIHFRLKGLEKKQPQINN